MKKVFSALLFCAASCVATFSQTVDSKKTAFQLSFFPPLSTNGAYSYEYTNGVSFNILAGFSNNEEAFAFAGLANVVLNDAKGFQFAGLTNYAGNGGQGMQLSGLANITKNEYKGFQFAGVINLARDVTGFQFAGLVNKARNVEGVQFAGFINIAEHSDYPIGFINLIKDGEKSMAITYNELGSTMITFRSGGDVTYGIIGVGYNHRSKGRMYTTEAGLGAHINCLPWLRINNEIKLSSFGYANNPFIFDEETNTPAFHGNYSILPAFKVARHFELFGGPSLNYLNASQTNSSLAPNHSLWKKESASRYQRIYIGYQAGVQYVF